MLLIASVHAQPLVIKGQLIDEVSGAAVPYATIRLDGTGQGTISNSLGEFTLKLSHASPQQSLQISCLGYSDQTIRLSAFEHETLTVIQLREQVFSLEEVVIYSTDITAQEMLQLAIDHIPDNYPQHSYVLNTFYRHYCKEGNVYGRLIEAAIDLYDKKGYKKAVKNPGKKFGVKFRQLRRSIDFTNISGYSHKAHALPSALRMDVAAYKNFESLAKQDKSYINFYFEDTTYYQGKVVYVVRSESRRKTRSIISDFYISADDFAILRYEQEHNSTYRSRTVKTNWKGKHILSYQPYQGKYYLGHSLDEGWRFTQDLDSTGEVLNTDDHYHHVELMVNEIQTKSYKKLSGSMPDEAELAAIPYDPGFWNTYTVLQATPLEQDIQQDLEARISLDDQFRGDDRTGKLSQIQDEMMTRRLDRMLATQGNQPILLCFWDSNYKPGLKELLFAKKLAKEYSGTNVRASLIFISLDRNEAEWDAAIRKYRLYLGQHLRLAKGLQAGIAKRYGVTGSPYFVLMDKSKSIILQGSELPKRSQIGDLMERLGD